MKRVLFLLLPFALTSCSSISELAIRYECPSCSGLVLDDYTGKPKVGTTVQVLGSISRPRFPEGHEVRNVCLVTVTTDEYGIYTLPAWTNEVGMAWDYYEQIVVLKPGQKPIELDVFGCKEGILPHGPVIRTVKLRQNQITRDEYVEQENRLTADVPEEVLSNSLVFYTAHVNLVNDGRFIDSPDPSKGGYVRPKPELVIGHIKSFSVSETSAYGDRDYKTTAITLIPADARRLEVLRRTRANADRSLNEFVVLVGNKPMSSIWEPDAHSTPSGYLIFHKGRDTHEVVQALQKLVQHK